MGSKDGAETRELLGLFSLYSIGEKLNKDNIGLYSDDGLAYFKIIIVTRTIKLGES